MSLGEPELSEEWASDGIVSLPSVVFTGARTGPAVLGRATSCGDRPREARKWAPEIDGIHGA
ncbi:hypothetical protein [Streptomyces sp. NPDC002078]